MHWWCPGVGGWLMAGPCRAWTENGAKVGLLNRRREATPHFCSTDTTVTRTEEMSFAVDLENQREISPKSPNDTKIGLIITKASNLLTDFANGVNGLERLIQQLGSKRDSQKLRSTIETVRITELTDYKTQLEHLINDISHLISSNVSVNSEDKFSEEKLRKEFESVTNNFNHLKRVYADRSHSIILNDRIANKAALIEESSITSSTANEQTPLMSQQQIQHPQSYAIQQQELDLHTVLAEERASEIKKIHGGVEEINSIYKQIGYLVQQQGQQVDTVEGNMTSLTNNAQNAQQELVKADNYQKKKGRWTCYLLVFLAVFTLIVVLTIFA